MMGRIRSIKPEFPQSESMGKISRDARLLFIMLWTVVDDEGRARGSSRMLASLLYPYDDDAPRLIDGWLKELEGARCIHRYEVDGSKYLEIENWLKHQKIDHATTSKFPPPRESSRILAPDLDLDLGSRILEGAKAPLSETSSDPPKKRMKKYTEEFNIFWKAYPTDANMSKFEAFQAWQRLSDEHRKAAIDSIPAFKAYCASKADYRPIHACRYLTKKRFEGHLEKGNEMKARVILAPHGPAWNAWRTYYRDHRKNFALHLMERFEREGKEYHAPAEWPPGMNGGIVT
jgi:hypothetical protein